MDRSRRRGTGFTLVELLVVIAIIGILIALLLPAVQAAREAARRTQCTSNLKQLALALQNYHDARKILPPSVQFDWGEDPSTSDNYRANWVILALPYMEEQNTFNQFNLKLTISNPANRSARGISIATMLCPSDVNGQRPFAGNAGTNEGDNWARGNYAANGANAFLLSNASSWVHCGMNGLGPGQCPGWVDTDRRGVMGPCISLTLPKILDGTSHTMLLAEVRVGINEFDRRGTWAMGTAGSSALFAHGFGGDDDGPNACNDDSDDIRGCDYLYGTSPGQATMLSECMSCWPGNSDQATVRSRHAGGVFTAFCDGSVHFIAETINTSGVYGSTPSVWDRLITSCDGALNSTDAVGVDN